jgi:tetratricopeptide (TPR) repeat protein
VRSGDWRDDETLFRAALATNPDATVVAGFLTRELLRQGRTEEAERLIGDVGSAPPEGAGERARLSAAAIAAMQRGDWARAAELLQQITATASAKGGDWLNLGTALTNLGRYDEARRAFREALRQEPRDAAALRMLGRVDVETARFESAREHFERALEIEPDSAAGWYGAMFAAWRAAGDGAAMELLARAEARGVDVGEWIREDRTAWNGAGHALQTALDAATGSRP